MELMKVNDYAMIEFKADPIRQNSFLVQIYIMWQENVNWRSPSNHSLQSSGNIEKEEAERL